MAVNFKIPASPAVQIYENDTFLGADFTSDAGNIDDNKSPDVVNMIRSVPGKIRKRMGYKQVGTLGDRVIHGVHYYSFANAWLIHAGDRLYHFKGGVETYWVDRTTPGDPNTERNVITEDNYFMLFDSGSIETTSSMTLLYTGMAEKRSTAYELNQMLVILDGKKMLYVRWDQTDDYLKCGKMEDYPDITVPLVRISCLPNGSGQDYQAFNLLTTRFEQDFIIDSSHSTATSLKLYTDKIADATVKMQILNNQGEWVDKTEGTDFTVNRTNGTIYSISSMTKDPIVSASALCLEANYYTGERWYTFTCTITSSKTAVSYHADIPHVNRGRQYTVPDDVRCRMTVTTSGGQTYTKEFYVKTPYGDRSGTVDFSSQVVTQTSTPFPVTPVAGMDNIKVFASYVPNSSGAELVNHCRFGILFGVNGATDRLFVSGNENYGDELDEYGNPTGGSYTLKNRDWYSDRNDPTYFPDTGYSEIGSDTSAIMGYSIVNSYLATFKDEFETSQTVFIREGDLITSDLDGDQNEETNPAFKLINTLQGAGAISSYCFDYLEVEPIFLSKKGIYALTSQDITGEKYAQNRSYFLDRKLLAERNLNSAIGLTWKDYYVLCVNNHFYILDGLQPLRTDKSAPYALRQYVSFYFEFNNLNEGENITYIWNMFGRFYFGTNKGRVMRFFNDENDIKSYNDNGDPIPARWQTPDISGKLFYKNKTFRYIALKVSPARNSSMIVEGEKNGVWEEIKAEYAKIKYFSFEGLTFAKTAGGHPQFTFQCDKTQKTVTTKTRIKKVDKVLFRFSNSELNEPLGINNFALEYTQGGNIK